MKKYKVEITKTYIIDVLANDRQQAEDKASSILNVLMRQGTEHYKEGETFYQTYDVTNTDDPFNPDNQ